MEVASAMPAGNRRKRDRHNMHQSEDNTKENQNATNSNPTKRSRSKRWSLGPSETDTSTVNNNAPSETPRKTSRFKSRKSPSQSSRRPSKFQEGSMNDRPSNKPDSVFLRPMQPTSGNSKRMSVDRLMESYHAEAGMPSSKGSEDSSMMSTNDERHTGPATPFTHHRNASEISNSSTRERIAHFGRTITRPFTPSYLIQKWNENWEAARQEVMERDHKVAMEKWHRQREQFMLQQRKEESEALYAQLKREGKLGTIGTTHRPHAAKIFAEGYSATSLKEPRARPTSMVQLETAGPATLSGAGGGQQTPATINAGDSSWLSSLFKVPSIANLRKSASIASLQQQHNRAATASPEKQTHDNSEMMMLQTPSLLTVPPRALRNSASSKALGKHAKLSKRVSNLEQKLADARAELEAALNAPTPTTLATPVSNLPKSVPSPLKDYQRPLPQAQAQAQQQPRPRSVISTRGSKEFTPGALPRLDSESLLLSGRGERQRITSTGEVVDREPVVAEVPEPLEEATEEAIIVVEKTPRIIGPTPEPSIQHNEPINGVDETLEMYLEQQPARTFSAIFARQQIHQRQASDVSDSENDISRANSVNQKNNDKGKGTEKGKKRKSSTGAPSHESEGDGDTDIWLTTAASTMVAKEGEPRKKQRKSRLPSSVSTTNDNGNAGAKGGLAVPKNKRTTAIAPAAPLESEENDTPGKGKPLPPPPVHQSTIPSHTHGTSAGPIHETDSMLSEEEAAAEDFSLAVLDLSTRAPADTAMGILEPIAESPTSVHSMNQSMDAIADSSLVTQSPVREPSKARVRKRPASVVSAGAVKDSVMASKKARRSVPVLSSPTSPRRAKGTPEAVRDPNWRWPEDVF